MATDAKRLKTEEVSSSTPADSDRLQDFLRWCAQVGLTLSSKVCVSSEGTVSGYGLLAKEDVEEGEVLFSVPRSALLTERTSKIAECLEEGKAALQNSSGWVPLLLALLYEYTTPQSRWRPYLSLWTDFGSLDQPMFWPQAEREQLLKGTGVPEAVDTDLKNIQREYQDIVLPFIRRHPDVWNPAVHNLELYRHLVAFVMAYSFQEPQEEEEDDDDDEEEEKHPNPPMMVPMADMLNHVASHNASLEFGADVLRMVAVRRIAAGQEVFNTYGQMANWQLLHMYGFAEPHHSNSNDTADIPMSLFYKAGVQVTESEEDQRLLVEKWSMLGDMEMVGEEGVFIFGKSCCLTDTEMFTTLRVLCMSAADLQEFQDNEGWEEVQEGEDEAVSRALSVAGLPGLPAAWRLLLHAAAGFSLAAYREGAEPDRALLEDPGALAALSSRQQRALQVRYGQKAILGRLMELTKP